MKLKEIVTNINTTIKSNLTGDYQKGAYNGLAKLVLQKDSDDADRYIAMIYSDGRETRCEVDDTNPLILYHRCLSINQEEATNISFGDGRGIKETVNMIAVVYSKSSMSACQEDLASIIMASFPDTLSIDGVFSTDVITQGINNDSFAVYNQEYKSNEYRLNPEDYYFSIGYTVETTFDKSCVEKCC